MRRTSHLLSVVIACLGLTILPSPAASQEPVAPTISARQFAGGSATLKVTGSFQIDQEVAINAPASFGDGEYTWIQFGVSGAATPNVLITYGDQGYGIMVGLGKRIVTAEPQHCKGSAVVTGSSVTGNYTCTGVTSYDAATGTMGKVDIQFRFSART